MNNPIKIINYWWTENYGANLTAYSLIKILEKYSDNIFLLNLNKICSYLKFDKNKNFSLFRNKYFKLKARELQSKTNKGPIYITGSDQVFRPIYTNKMLDEYLLDFVNPNEKKIAFSASFGIDKEKFLQENSSEIIEHMKNSLKSFDFISVREKSGVEICKDIFEVDAEWIIDPVFIMNKSYYNELVKDSTKDFSNKIISYVLDSNKEYKKAYKYLSKIYNLKVTELANSNESIENWLAAIKNCEFLITDSFHGMCFAIIFNKPFICLVNKQRGASRFESILEMLNIENQCIIDINEIYEKNCIFKVDYDRVNQRIEEERQRGLDFLKTVLEAPVGKREEKIEAKLRFLENKVCELETQATLKYQIKQELWNLWLIIFHKYLPNFIKSIIRFVRDKICK